MQAHALRLDALATLQPLGRSETERGFAIVCVWVWGGGNGFWDGGMDVGVWRVWDV